MKQTTNNLTLFQALCSKFISKNGGRKSKAAVAVGAYLVPVRDTEGAIQQIKMVFKDQILMEISRDVNGVTLHAPGNEFSRVFQTRLNRVLSLVGLKLENVEGGAWRILDNAGQAAPFKNNQMIDLSRPHGEPIYPTAE